MIFIKFWPGEGNSNQDNSKFITLTFQFFFQFLKKYTLLFHLQKYFKKFDTRIFPPSISLSYFLFILDMAHRIDWGKGKSFDFFLPQRRSDFHGLLIFRQKYEQ